MLHVFVTSYTRFMYAINDDRNDIREKHKIYSK